MTQILIHFARTKGPRITVTAKPGMSLMELAVQSNIHEIEAKCFGNCCCVTCHVYIDDLWINSFGEKTEMEDSMLDFGENIDKRSRLSCQIFIEDKHNGLVVNIPETQRVIGL